MQEMICQMKRYCPCVAEALLRIPDSATRDALIENQILKETGKDTLNKVILCL